MALTARPQGPSLAPPAAGKRGTHGRRADARLPMPRAPGGGASYCFPLQDPGGWADGFEEVPRSYTPDSCIPQVTAASFLEVWVLDTQEPQLTGVCKRTPVRFGKEARSSCLFVFIQVNMPEETPEISPICQST